VIQACVLAGVLAAGAIYIGLQECNLSALPAQQDGSVAEGERQSWDWVRVVMTDDETGQPQVPLGDSPPKVDSWVSLWSLIPLTGRCQSLQDWLAGWLAAKSAAEGSGVVFM
jgi:hypothetical protein